MLSVYFGGAARPTAVGVMLLALYLLAGFGCGLVFGVLIGASGRSEPWPMRRGDAALNWLYRCPGCGTEMVP
jgi:hypothetical protein